MVHGNDFVTCGTYEDCQWLESMIRQNYQMSTNVIGAAMGLEKEVRVLNRKIVWHEDVGLTLEADQRHAEMLINEFADKLTPLKTPTIPELVEPDVVKEEQAINNNTAGKQDDPGQ